MLLTIAILLASFCTGILVASARVPQVRVLPLLCAAMLAVLSATVLFVLSPSNFLLAMLFLLVAIVSATTYSAWLWTKELGSESPGFWRLVALELYRPSYVRKAHEASRVEATTVSRVEAS